MRNEVTIRRAANADLDAVGRLWQEFMDFHRDREQEEAPSAIQADCISARGRA